MPHYVAPQYLGLILIVVAFLTMWPTALTILLAPFLMVIYFLLAKEEDRELGQKFRDEFTRYKEAVAAFIPSLGNKTVTTFIGACLILIGGISQAQTVEETLAALGKGPTLGNANARVTIEEELSSRLSKKKG